MAASHSILSNGSEVRTTSFGATRAKPLSVLVPQWCVRGWPPAPLGRDGIFRASGRGCDPPDLGNIEVAPRSIGWRGRPSASTSLGPQTHSSTSAGLRPMRRRPCAVGIPGSAVSFPTGLGTPLDLGLWSIDGAAKELARQGGCAGRELLPAWISFCSASSVQLLRSIS